MALFKKKNKNVNLEKDTSQRMISSPSRKLRQEVNEGVPSAKRDIQNKKNQERGKDKKIKVEEKNSSQRLTTRAAIIMGINFIGIIVIVIVLGRLSAKALELKKLKNSILTAEQSAEVNFADLELKSNKESAEKLLALYPDEEGLVNFVQEIEKLKKLGTVTNFSFVNQTPVVDKTGYLGIPVAIEIKGSWREIGMALTDLQKLPYLFRSVSLSTQPSSEDNLIIVRYGGFLYVDESFEEK